MPSFSTLAGLSLLYLSTTTTATVLPRAGPPTVSLDSAVFTGTSFDGVDKFLGIPYAKPPTGDRRFRNPEPVAPYNGPYSAITYGPSCPQQDIKLSLIHDAPVIDDVVATVVNTFYHAVVPDSEDCLTLNVVRPATATSSSKLPVVAWIYGGGFQIGSTSIYDGGLIVSRSIKLGEPVIYVSMNYRLSVFGFLAGQEVKAAGAANLGLQDQREAFRWIQKYIGAFGGDPTKVTIWGESAGAFSVGMHLVANDGDSEGLFRGGFMQSGTILPVGDISHGQNYYDTIVEQCGCSGAADTLACLRTVPYPVLKKAADDSPSIASYQSLGSPWIPRVDGYFIRDVPTRLVREGKIANVPFVAGNVEDEGTLFQFSSLNITTTEQFKNYFKSVFVPAVTDEELELLANHYPQDKTKGSPYNTGILNALTPQSKRIAAVLGDAVLIAPRRHLLQQRSGMQNTWSFLSKRLKATPFLGAFHASDLLQVYAPSTLLGKAELRDYLINFVTNLNPNGPHLIDWPKYSSSSPRQITFQDSIALPLVVTQDNYRVGPMQFLVDALFKYPF